MDALNLDKEVANVKSRRALKSELRRKTAAELKAIGESLARAEDKDWIRLVKEYGETSILLEVLAIEIKELDRMSRAGQGMINTRDREILLEKKEGLLKKELEAREKARAANDSFDAVTLRVGQVKPQELVDRLRAERDEAHARWAAIMDDIAVLDSELALVAVRH
jgi:hypothetical protein